ncbi:MAG: hypothetical protein WA981_10230 [Glaciecola sp.]
MSMETAHNETNQQAQDTPDDMTSVEASFNDTFAAIEAAVHQKLSKLNALKSLAGAELKLSLKALVIMIFGACAFITLALTIWVVVNVGIGLALFTLFSNVWFSLMVLMAINAGLFIALYRYLSRIVRQIGLPKTLSSFSKEH